jgi:hypothetical protein
MCTTVLRVARKQIGATLHNFTTLNRLIKGPLFFSSPAVGRHSIAEVLAAGVSLFPLSATTASGGPSAWGQRENSDTPV